MPTDTSRGRTARERARAEITSEITAIARRHLATEGAGGLSLRAVARDLGMVSSAVYRYVPSRDALLTTLITEGYDALGAHVEQAEQAVRRSHLERRWMTSCTAAREWALQRPSEWALLFGSPVPGYVAPRDTVSPATRLPLVLVGVMHDAVARGALDPDLTGRVPPRVRAMLAPARAEIGEQMPDELLLRALMAWTYLVGTISFELFGHRVGSTNDDDLYFTEEMRRVGAWVGAARAS